MNELDGIVTDGKLTEKETPMVPKVVKVGTKPKVVKQLLHIQHVM